MTSLLPVYILAPSRLISSGVLPVTLRSCLRKYVALQKPVREQISSTERSVVKSNSTALFYKYLVFQFDRCQSPVLLEKCENPRLAHMAVRGKLAHTKIGVLSYVFYRLFSRRRARIGGIVAHIFQRPTDKEIQKSNRGRRHLDVARKCIEDLPLCLTCLYFLHRVVDVT